MKSVGQEYTVRVLRAGGCGAGGGGAGACATCVGLGEAVGVEGGLEAVMGVLAGVALELGLGEGDAVGVAFAATVRMPAIDPRSRTVLRGPTAPRCTGVIVNRYGIRSSRLRKRAVRLVTFSRLVRELRRPVAPTRKAACGSDEYQLTTRVPFVGASTRCTLLMGGWAAMRERVAETGVRAYVAACAFGAATVIWVSTASTTIVIERTATMIVNGVRSRRRSSFVTSECPAGCRLAGELSFGGGVSMMSFLAGARRMRRVRTCRSVDG